MEIETYSKTINDTEYKLSLKYEKRVSAAETPDLSNIDPSVLTVQEYPDEAVLSIRSQGRERILSLSSVDYREVRDLLAKDVTSGRFIRGSR